ncbi:MAG: hypothetical protein UEU47_11650 [Oscillospiraceae bacterium]|nr:hypothetical protein [Oscillospiraceae bacterium]
MSKHKKNIQDNGGFQHWFVNVFWYHYKWPLLIGVVVLGIIVFITVDSLRKERYDTTVVIATDYYVDETQLDALDQVLKPVVGDIDGNGKVNICYAVLYVGNTEVGRENQERMYLYMSQQDVGLYLMSENVSDAYTNPELEYFTDSLSDMGLPCDADDPVRLSLKDNSVLAECGMENMYLSIMDFTSDSGNATARHTKEAAVSMAQALIDAGDSGDNS